MSSDRASTVMGPDTPRAIRLHPFPQFLGRNKVSG